VGRAIVERLAGAGHTVVIIEMDEAAVDWVPDHPAAARLGCVIGSASNEDVAEAAADQAEAAAPLGGWVNNAALFRDAALHAARPGQIMDLINANLAPVVTGCAVAVRRFLIAGRGGPGVMSPSWHLAASEPGRFSRGRWRKTESR
jgi:NAD(P)-dependent dehydrogenase (short-subunit alcohol dehydrogenase family)